VTICVIQARLGSTRFFRKALADLAGKPVIQHVVDRAKQIDGVGEVVVAWPAIDFGHVPHLGVAQCFVAGREVDVLGRYARVVERYPEAEVIVRITGDCPLLDPAIAEEVIALLDSDRDAEYASNIAPGYVDGEDVEVFSRAALEWAAREATDLYDREHVTPWIRRHCKTATLLPATSNAKPKTSIDTPEDLERVRAMLEATC
jgi:spore coat polysaccharide biosynthesis protein SpsF (cytidylyltransferase family)